MKKIEDIFNIEIRTVESIIETWCSIAILIFLSVFLIIIMSILIANM